MQEAVEIVSEYRWVGMGDMPGIRCVESPRGVKELRARW